MHQAAACDCLAFDPFPFDQNSLSSPEVDVGWGQIADAFVMALSRRSGLAAALTVR